MLPQDTSHFGCCACCHDSLDCLTADAGGTIQAAGRQMPGDASGAQLSQQNTALTM